MWVLPTRWHWNVRSLSCDPSRNKNKSLGQDSMANGKQIIEAITWQIQAKKHIRTTTLLIANGALCRITAIMCPGAERFKCFFSRKILIIHWGCFLHYLLGSSNPLLFHILCVNTFSIWMIQLSYYFWWLVSTYFQLEYGISHIILSELGDRNLN